MVHWDFHHDSRGVWVNDQGDVWRYGKVTKGTWFAPSKKHPTLCSYYKIRLQRKTVQVATLVCKAFHGDCPAGCTVDHIDRDTKNNQASNLRWATLPEQMRNTKVKRSATHGHNTAIKYRKLGEGEWQDAPGMGILADEKGFCQASISRACNGKIKQHHGYEFKFA